METLTKIPLTVVLIFLVILVGNSKICPLQVVESCNVNDKEALLEFKRVIQFDVWQYPGAWAPDTDCCTTWEGISCDPVTGRVVEIRMSGFPDDYYGVDTFFAMGGTLSPFLGNLTYLRVLDLRFGLFNGPIPPDLSGPVPNSLGKLSQLEYIYLDHNELSGAIPTCIGKLSALQMLYLHHNRLTGPIPFSIGRLVDLQMIDLGHNQLTGVLPSSIGNLTQIKSIILENNMITGNLPQSIGYLNELRDVLFSNNKFIGPIPPSFGNLSLLKRLLLSKNMLSGDIPSNVLNLKNLEVFNVSTNQLTGKIPPHKSSFPASAFSQNLGLCDAPLPPCNWL
ncbi:hypothetical protein RDABS01_015164 [Bienertia sinuspersici]